MPLQLFHHGEPKDLFLCCVMENMDSRKREVDIAQNLLASRNNHLSPYCKGKEGPDKPALESKLRWSVGRNGPVEKTVKPAPVYFGTSPGSDLTL
jgi:hypothetical protein